MNVKTKIKLLSILLMIENYHHKNIINRKDKKTNNKKICNKITIYCLIKMEGCQKFPGNFKFENKYFCPMKKCCLVCRKSVSVLRALSKG